MATKPKRSTRKKTSAKKAAPKKKTRAQIIKELEKSVTPALKRMARKTKLNPGGVNIKPVKTQKGKSKAVADEGRKAMAPGYRLSRNGNVYYEVRKNRSDMPGKKK